MSNTLSVIDMVAAKAMKHAHEKATFIGTINRSYDDSFGKTGGKIGSTLRVRDPNQFSVTDGRAMVVQDVTETTQTVTLATQYHVGIRFNSAELELSIDEIDDRYIEPAMNTLVSKIDGEALVQATKDTYNIAGTAGTPVGTVTSGFADTSALGLARAKLNQGLAPKSNRFVQMDSITMASLTNGIKPLFHPESEVRKGFLEGHIGHAMGTEFYENERVWTMTHSDDVTADTDAAALVTDGGVVIDMHTLLPVAKQTVGTVFTVAGVYAVHPETKAKLSHLQQFTIVSIGATTTTVSPTIYLTGPKQNVASATGAVLATTAFNAAAVVFVGAASTSYVQSLMYHRDAFTFVTADLPLMSKSSEECVRMVKDGIALRVWKDSDIRNDELLMRIDILWGFKTLRSAWATRITS